MTKKLHLAAVVAGAILFTAVFTAAQGDKGESLLLSFVVGDYAIVGQGPDSSTPYSGTARISKLNDKLLLTRKIGSGTITAEGRIETPKPPEEGEVLRFRWIDKYPVVMTCLVSSDLDNYSRLTCYLIQEGQKNIHPGIEAMFPTATWPDSASGKRTGRQ